MEREIPLLTVRQIAELGDEDVIILHRNFKPIQAYRMSVERYPVLVKRQHMDVPPVPLLPSPHLPPFLPNWRRRYLQPGAYSLFGPGDMARWPVIKREEETP